MPITCKITSESPSYAVSMGSRMTDEAMEEMDNETIMVAYKILKEVAEKIGLLSNQVHSATEYCTANDLAINGQTYQDSVENCSNCFQFASKNIDEYAELLKELVQKGSTSTQEEREESTVNYRVQTDDDGIKTYYVDDHLEYNVTLPESEV